MRNFIIKLSTACKIISIAAMPPNDYGAFKTFCTENCARKPFRSSDMT